MNCKLCDKEIEKYDARLNHVKIDSQHEADICLDCVKKLADWQGKLYSVLFPTNALKKRFGKE